MKKLLRIVITIVIIAAVVAGIAGRLSANKKKNDEKTSVVAATNSAIAVKADTVKLQPLELSFTANGKFAPGQELTFAAETSGRVISVLVDEGDYVKKGQTLAIIKTDNLAVDVQNAKEAYENALRDKQRFENAFKTGGVTQQQLDQAELALKNAAARVQQANIKVTDANLRASINGIINKRMIEPGSVLSPGAQLFEIVDVSKLTLDIAVPEANIANLKNGDAVKVTVGVLPGKTFSGKISFIAPKADAQLNFPVKIDVVNASGNAIKAGMYGTASFEFPQQVPTILVPRGAFVGSVSSNQVFVVKEDKAILRTVVAGRVFGDKVEVLEGLSEGESVITSGQINLVDGSAVTIIQ